MNGIIIYKGKYSATKQYAEWLAAELNLPLKNSNNITETQLRNYDTLIFGSSVYIGKMLIKNWLKQNLAALVGKKIFFYVVCGTASDKKIKLQSYIQASIPAEIRNVSEIYFLPGRLIWKDLSWWDRFMMKMGAFFEKDPETKKQMQNEYDGVKKENLSELVAAIKKSLAEKKESLQQENWV
jgi:menaquinone-dependent protoporphyrinogen IX oxidase